MNPLNNSNNIADSTQNNNIDFSPAAASGSGGVNITEFENDDQVGKKSFLSKFDFTVLADYLILLISFGVIILSLIFILIPQFARISTIRAEIEDLDAELVKVSSQRKYLSDLVDVKDQFEENLVLAKQTLPESEDEIPFILDQLIQIADESGVTINGLTLSGAVDSSSAKAGVPIPVRFRMDISASRAAYLRFFEVFESASRIVNISSFNLSSRGSGTTSESAFSEVSITLTLVSYFMSDIDAEGVAIEQITLTPKYSEVLDYIGKKKFYEPNAGAENIEIVIDESLVESNFNFPEVGNNPNLIDVSEDVSGALDEEDNESGNGSGENNTTSNIDQDTDDEFTGISF